MALDPEKLAAKWAADPASLEAAIKANPEAWGIFPKLEEAASTEDWYRSQDTADYMNRIHKTDEYTAIQYNPNEPAPFKPLNIANPTGGDVSDDNWSSAMFELQNLEQEALKHINSNKANQDQGYRSDAMSDGDYNSKALGILEDYGINLRQDGAYLDLGPTLGNVTDRVRSGGAQGLGTYSRGTGVSATDALLDNPMFKAMVSAVTAGVGGPALTALAGTVSGELGSGMSPTELIKLAADTATYDPLDDKRDGNRTAPDDVPTNQDQVGALDNELNDRLGDFDSWLKTINTDFEEWDWKPPEKQPVEEDLNGGGGGGADSSSTAGSTAPSPSGGNTTTGSTEQKRGRYHYEGNGIWRDKKNGETIYGPGNDGDVYTNDEMAEAWETGEYDWGGHEDNVEESNAEEEKPETSIVGGILGIDIDDIIFGTEDLEDNTSIVEATIVESTMPQAGDGELVLGPGAGDGTQGTANTGYDPTGSADTPTDGTGDSNDIGDGPDPGPGTDPGNGPGENGNNGPDTGSPVSNTVSPLFAGGGDGTGLFDYTTVAPVRPASLNMMDYVAALKGRR